jgi:uncharacterized protein YukE
MADDTSTIVADATDITGLAKAFGQFKTDIDGALKGLDTVNVATGNFQDGDDLKKTITERTTELQDNLTALSKALDDISTNLTTIANNYTNTDEQNKLGANALDDMIKKIDGDLPVLGKK